MERQREKQWEKQNQDATVSAQKNLVYSCLDCAGKTVEEIMELTGLSLGQVRMELLELLMEDQIRESSKGYYSVVS